MAHSTLEEKCLGLDPVSRSTMKLFIRDIAQLQPLDCHTPRNTSLLGFKDHVVNRVEIMGIVVREDKKDNRQSYAVDDGTGVIQCTLWNNTRNDDLLNSLTSASLSLSLQGKLAELRDSSEQKHNVGYSLGDLVLVRGSIKHYRGRLEIDVLGIRKIDNPCLEYQRVLELPALYKLYDQSIRLPAAVERAAKIDTECVFNEQAVTVAIAGEIQNKSGATDERAETVFSMSDILKWPSISTLLDQHKAAETDRKTRPECHTAVVQEALEKLEKERGWLVRHRHPDSDVTHKYEIITAYSPLARLVLLLLRNACNSSERNSERGCHILTLLDRLKRPQVSSSLNRASGGSAVVDGLVYKDVTQKALSRCLACLEANSDVIDAGFQRYLPVSM